MAKQRPLVVFLRTTLIGGVVFLVPLLLVLVLLRHGIEIAGKMAKPVMAALPEPYGSSVAVGTIIASLALFLVAFAAGLSARTGPGQRLFGWFENSLIGSLPQFNFVRGVAESFDGDGEHNVKVVLAPTDAGWSLGFIFAPEDSGWVAVFLPGAPDWKSGSVAYAETRNLRSAGINFATAIRSLSKLGSGSEVVIAALAKGGAAGLGANGAAAED